MTTDRDLERLLDGWFDEHTTTPPADLLSRSAERIDRVAQRPGFLAAAGFLVGVRPIGGRALVATAALPLVLASIALAAIGSEIFGPRLPLAVTNAGVWQPGDDVAFRAQVDPALGLRFKWRAGTYSEFTLSGWSWGDVERESVPANGSLATFEAGGQPATTGRRRAQVTITPDAFGDRTIIGPALIDMVDQPVDALLTDGWLTSIETEAVPDRYTLSVLLHDPAAPGALTELGLRTAQGSYPPGLVETYAALPAGAVGQAAAALLERIRATIPEASDRGNPYALALAMETYLRDPANFTYATDVRTETAAQCRDISVVECFAIIRRGFCEHYASTMAVLLRHAGIPARIAYGFLPGQRGTDGLEVVRGSSALWWVEVYFPGYGWVEFDPTGGGVGQPQVFPVGDTGA